MKGILTVLMIITFCSFAKSNDTISYYQSTEPTFIIKVSAIDLKIKIKNTFEPNSINCITFLYLIDSIEMSKINTIIYDETLLKYQVDREDYLLIHKALFALIKESKAQILYNNKSVILSEIQISKKFRSHCTNKIINQKRGARYKIWVFTYKKEIIGTLPYKCYWRIVNCL